MDEVPTSSTSSGRTIELCREARRRPGASASPIALIEELLDAHEDTARLAAELEGDRDLALHLAYLRDLQRTAREILARVTSPSAPR